MAPLILHNVPDDERYIGDDGIQRPYAMVFPQQDGAVGRSRKATTESGAFGKSTRRSRSRTGTPARREDPTITAADKVFSSWMQEQSKTASSQDAAGGGSGSNGTKTNGTTGGTGSNKLSPPTDDSTASTGNSRLPTTKKRNAPTEIILRGFRSTQQQYAVVNHYEQLAGRICEDYPRDPPAESRRYKSELRDPAFTRRQALTAEERIKVNRADSGAHWVKVTFESAETAERAVAASPQSILGHLVYAEPYHGIAPARDEAEPEMQGDADEWRTRSPTRRRHAKKASFSTYIGQFGSGGFEGNGSQGSSRTADTATMSNDSSQRTLSSGTATGIELTPLGRKSVVDAPVPVPVTPAAASKPDDEFCTRIPTARKVRLLPAEQALLPQPSWAQRVFNQIPFLRWFNGNLIGNEVPRTDTGEFDWDKASLYWKFIYWLDKNFRLFGGEIMSVDKDD